LLALLTDFLLEDNCLWYKPPKTRSPAPIAPRYMDKTKPSKVKEKPRKRRPRRYEPYADAVRVPVNFLLIRVVCSSSFSTAIAQFSEHTCLPLSVLAEQFAQTPDPQFTHILFA